MDVIVYTIATGFRFFMGLNVVYARPLRPEDVSLYIITTVVILVASTLGNVAVIFISEVYLRLQVAERSSVNLLNGMHEGILILSHATSEKPH